MRKILFSIFLFIFILHMCKTSPSVFIDASLSNFPTVKIKEEKKAFHIFSHGRPGELFINGQWLEKEKILYFLKDKIKDQKELLIYGCEFAKGKKGKEAVHYLEKKLNIKVSASTDLTGLNGNWTLEYGKSLQTLKLSAYKGSYN